MNVMNAHEKEIIKQIEELKNKKNAFIIAHNYQSDIVQDIADLVGDSLELAKKSKETDKDIIVFCGVYFMAETAKILSPEKKVLLPNLDAGCPLANMITSEDVRKLKNKYSDSKVVCYVNSSASVKAESDVCCTSSNAVKIVNNIDAKKIIFIPDQNLGYYVSTKVNKEIILWHGFCPTHHRITKEEILIKKKEYPNALVISHPECNHEVLSVSDFIGSTSQLIAFTKQSDKNEFIVVTERGVLHRMKKDNPNKKFYLASERLVCPNMKKTTLENILDVLKYENNEIKLDETVRAKALKSIESMLKF
jgi:quinolinate synthase